MSDEPIRYMERTRNYYRALGYERDYRWAQNDDAPFARLDKPLSEARIACIGTSYLPDPAGGSWSPDNPPPKEVWSHAVADAPADLYNQNLAWDKEQTHTRDRESYLPLKALAALADRGVIGGIAPRFHGVPTVYSHRETTEADAPKLLERLREDQADAALLAAL